MVYIMRTTVAIDDNLLAAAKEKARASGRSLGDVLEDGLRLLLAEQAPVEPFLRPTFRGTGVKPGVDLDSNAALHELLDEGVPLDKLR